MAEAHHAAIAEDQVELVAASARITMRVNRVMENGSPSATRRPGSARTSEQGGNHEVARRQRADSSVAPETVRPRNTSTIVMIR